MDYTNINKNTILRLTHQTMSITKDAIVRARIEPKRKNEAEHILDKLGITHSQAINLFYCQIVIHKGLPFPLNLEDEDTPENYIEIKNDEHFKSFIGMK